jgi:hypothetical protein
VRAAIAAGADFLETDVQMSRDGVLVIAHDSDFSRLGGVARKVWDLTYDEIRAITLRGRTAPDSPPEFTPTFDALPEEPSKRTWAFRNRSAAPAGSAPGWPTSPDISQPGEITSEKYPSPDLSGERSHRGWPRRSRPDRANTSHLWV